ncbi:hypothetical protein BJ138DRAFT_1239951 [Hygrophoropsis aurantiaca]|uniref:Uncharacterized protein n=1 Tax=Hygrophoropsis aurantiaca TaxID=72124 RepID=A0ACB7ZTC8_9AGAM|nr:hypothetical protein BJ138DRAFT_1239951 [Hygrophoropsis aurantiaca]
MTGRSQYSALRYLKSTKSSVRTPWRHRMKTKALKRTPAENKVLKDKREAHRTEYQEALADAQAVITQEAVKLRERFGSHSIEYYFEAIIQSSRIKKTKRSENRWNAFVRAETKRINAEIPDNQPRLKAHELTPEIAKRWHGMTAEERKNATESAMEDLVEFRQNKSTATHNVPIHAFHDCRTAYTRISEELTSLTARTGNVHVFIGVRNDQDHYSRPYVYVSDDRIADFFQLAVNQTVNDIATRLEAYLISGVTGVIRNHREAFLQLKSQTSALIHRKLSEAAEVPVSKMYYVNFDENITAKYRVLVENWPLPKFCNPGSIGSNVELKVLYNAWQSGATYFRKMTQDEFRRWEAGQAEQVERREVEPEERVERRGAEPEEGSNGVDEHAHSNDTGHPAPLASALNSVSPYANPSTFTSTSRKRTHEPYQDYVMTISGASGMEVQVPKKARKVRSDKGTKKGPRRKAN